MHTHRLTGVNKVAQKSDSRKRSNHAGCTGLTGLTGIAGAHMSIFIESIRQQHSFNKSHVRMKKTLLTLLTLFKASVHAGFSVTGLIACPVNPCKGA